MQNIRNFDYEVDTQNISRRYEDYIGLYIMYLSIKRFENNEPALTIGNIIEDNHLPIRLVNKLLNKLVDAGLIIEVVSENEDDRAFHPAMDINKLTLAHYNNCIESLGSELFLNNTTEEMTKFWEKNLEIKKSIEVKNETILIKNIFVIDNN